MSTNEEASRAPRRASKTTDLFVRCTLSEALTSKGIRPTIIIGMLYIKNPQPNVDLLKKTLGERILKLPRCSSIFVKENNKVYVKPIPKEQVNLDYHIRSIDGKGTFEGKDLNALITESSTKTWDYNDRPLWQLIIITNMKDGRSMLFWKLDHAIGDGGTLIAVLEKLIDGTFREQKVLSSNNIIKTTTRWSQRVTSHLYGCYYALIGWATEMNDPYNGLKIPSNISPLDPCPKIFSCTRRFDLDDIRNIKNKMTDTTINDIVVGITTIAIRRYFEETNDPIMNKVRRGTQLRAMAAVDMRPKNLSTEYLIQNMGNEFSTTCFSLPINYSNSVDAVWKTKGIMDQMKISPALHIIHFYVLEFLFKVLPETLMAKAMVDTVCKPTVVFSNVKGPANEVQIAGYPLDDINFVNSSPVGLYVGFLSYNNKLRVAVTSEETADIDCDLFIKCVEEGFEELKETVASHPGRTIDTPDLTSISAKILEVIALPAVVALVATGIHVLLKKR